LLTYRELGIPIDYLHTRIFFAMYFDELKVNDLYIYRMCIIIAYYKLHNFLKEQLCFSYTN